MAEFNRRITGFEAVRRAMGQLGLPSPASVVGNTDATVTQMLELLNQVGLDLVGDEYKWQVLTKTMSITTNAGQLQYALPDDFSTFYSEAFWSDTSRQPVVGPMTPQLWRLLKARSLGGQSFYLQYVLRQDQVELYSVPAENQALSIDYQSRGWVVDQTNPSIRRDYIKNDADTILFDASLVVAKLKMKWRMAKGFDTVAVQQEYQDAYDRAKGNDAPGITLSLAPGGEFPYLGWHNIPDTGYGL